MPGQYRIPPDAMMSTEGPQPMGMLSWMPTMPWNKPKDIPLPNESGVRDPRIPMSPIEALKEALGNYKAIASEDDPLKGLQKAGSVR